MQLPTDPSTRLERDALMAMLQYPVAVGRDLVAAASRVGFHNHALSVVRDAIAASLDRFGVPDWIAAVAEQAPTPYRTMIGQLAVAPLPQRADQVETYCRGVATALIDRELLRRKAELLGSLQRVDAVADPERYRALQRELVDLEKERRTLREE
jgi:DNA primase